MISRRNIRIKVMQNLYALKAHPESQTNTSQEKIRTVQEQTLKNMEESSRTFIQLLFAMLKIARYADQDARQRATKYLPSQEDLNVSTKIVRNPIVLKLQKNEGFRAITGKFHFESRMDKELIKKLYDRFIDLEGYKKYIQTEGNNRKADKEILSVLFHQLLFSDEDFEQFMDDQYIQWGDDKGMMKILVSNYLNKPGTFNFNHLLSEEKKEYAFELIRTVLEKHDHCTKWINPRLKNWDPDRVAVIDMLLLHMGICEFLYFPS